MARSKLSIKRFEEFKSSILLWKSEEQIRCLYDSGHSLQQVLSLFRHEKSSVFKPSDEDSVFHLKDQRLLLLLRRVVPYSKEQHTLHLSMPQWWKIRFRHLDKTDEEVKQLVQHQLQRWASNTHDIRRKKDAPYNSKQTLQYWIGTGLSTEDAQRKLLEYKRSCSPFTVEFWKNKGFSESEAQEKTNALHKRGGVASCTSLDKKFVSKLERDIFSALQERFTRSLKPQHCIDGKFVYDICDLKSRKIIEVNGTYWHADPRVYSSVNMLVCNGLTVSAVRERDVAKLEHAKKFGYDVFVVWEIDWHADREATIQKMLTFLG